MTTNKGKWMMGLLVLLLIANAATLIIFWVDRSKHGPAPKVEVKDFLVNQLRMDTQQQEQFEGLRKEHHEAVDSLRNKVREAKDHLFDLVKESNVTDSMKMAAAADVSRITEKIDLITLDHFQKLRAICRPDQQKRFDEILHEMTHMLGSQGRPGPPGPPPGRPEGPDGPPPPNGQ